MSSISAIRAALPIGEPEARSWRPAGQYERRPDLQRILDDETRHVAFGPKRFVAHCENRGLSPQNLRKVLVERPFKGSLKPPFNDSTRLAAGLSRDFYAGVA